MCNPCRPGAAKPSRLVTFPIIDLMCVAMAKRVTTITTTTTSGNRGRVGVR